MVWDFRKTDFFFLSVMFFVYILLPRTPSRQGPSFALNPCLLLSHVYVCMCLCVWFYVCMSVCMCMSMCVCAHTWACVCACMWGDYISIKKPKTHK